MVGQQAPLSRRRLIGLAGAAALLAGCGDDDGGETGSTQARNARHAADVEVLNAVRDVELEALAFYRAGLSLLRGGKLGAGRAVVDQLSRHADGLAQAIRDLDGSANKAQAEYAFPNVSDADGVLRFGLVLADRIVAAYVDAIPKLSDPRLRGVAASIVTTVAEHPIALRAALGEPALPVELVVGRA